MGRARRVTFAGKEIERRSVSLGNVRCAPKHRAIYLTAHPEEETELGEGSVSKDRVRPSRRHFAKLSGSSG